MWKRTNGLCRPDWSRVHAREGTEALWELRAPRESRRPPRFHRHTIWAELILGHLITPHTRGDNKARRSRTGRSEEDVDLNARSSSARNDLISVCRVNNAQKAKPPEVSIVGCDTGPGKKQSQPYCS